VKVGRTTKYYMNETPKWVIIDAKDKILGRLCVQIANILMGKHKARYTPNAVCGDNVIVINSKHIKVTGKKLTDKMYKRYSGYPSGNKDITLNELSAKNPNKVILHAVKGMVPKNWVGKHMLRGLKIYSEGAHEHAAQKPQLIEVLK
jgi:large subunit ribosomal protein L13